MAAIIALLILQAYCDLALPQFTADIVDIGIGQSGIEYAVPDYMREETLEKLALSMDEEGEMLLRGSYRKTSDGIYELSVKDEETIGRLNEKMEAPMAAFTFPSSEKIALDALSNSMISQMAINGVKTEYEAMGINIASVQTKYLLQKGGLMLGLSVLMMIASIFAGLLAARTSAQIGRDLRGKVFHSVPDYEKHERYPADTNGVGNASAYGNVCAYCRDWRCNKSNEYKDGYGVDYCGGCPCDYASCHDANVHCYAQI